MSALLKKRFGNLLASHRKRRGLTQAGLSGVAGVSKDMIARVEVGRSQPRFETIEKLAAALEINEAELFSAEITKAGLRRPLLGAISTRLSKLSDDDLVWLDGVLESILSNRKRSNI